MLKIFISLLILYRTLRCYPTTITYNYEAHPIMKTGTFYNTKITITFAIQNTQNNRDKCTIIHIIGFTLAKLTLSLNALFLLQAL